MRTVVSPLTVGLKVIDAPSGVTVAQPGGIPISYVRAATGRYNVYFPLGWLLFAATVTGDFSVANTVARASAGGGNAVGTAIDAGATGGPLNSTHFITVTAQRAGT